MIVPALSMENILRRTAMTEITTQNIFLSLDSVRRTKKFLGR